MYSRIGWTLAALASASIGVAVAQTTPVSPPGQSPAVKPPVAVAVAPPMASKPPMTAIPSPAATSAPMPVPPPVTTTTTSTSTSTAPSAVATSTTPVPAGAPVAGANSFTEGQARSRIEDQGFTDVINLAKDDQSIWRGTAMKGGVSSRVAVDYQGNVVIN